MDVTKANAWARDLAHYIRRHPADHISLAARVSCLVGGEGLDQNDVDQLTRKVRWILLARPRLRAIRQRNRSLDRSGVR
jgi:hypothetical protein